MPTTRQSKQGRKVSKGETESESTALRLSDQNQVSMKMDVDDVPSSNVNDNDITDFEETSDTAADDTQYDSFASFLKAFDYSGLSDDGHLRIKGGSGNTPDVSMIDSEREKSNVEESSHAITSQENMEDEEEYSNIRILSVPSKSSEIVLLHHSASLTLHGYVKVSPWYGNVRIFGYTLREGREVEVFSTEGTGLKIANTLLSMRKINIKTLRFELETFAVHEGEGFIPEIKGFCESVGRHCVVLCVTKCLLPVPLQFLELYYPTALQTRWVRNELSRMERSLLKEKNFNLCSIQKDYVIDLSGHFKMLSKQIVEVVKKAVSDDADFGPRILIRGEKNMGKSTLLRYLMNSCLNHVKEFYFLDTDPGQTEYTPPGVVSLFRVTKPLLGPPFAHQKKPLKMMFTGSITPGTSPKLHEGCVKSLMEYFNCKYQKSALFVNTIGWVHGVGEMCLQNIRGVVKPTIEIELVASDSGISFSKEVDENGITVFKVPSRAPTKNSGAPSYSAVQNRNFNIVAYFGQCQKSFLPVSLINSFHPVCVSYDDVAMFVIGKKVPPHRLIEAIHCSIVALCRVQPPFVQNTDRPAVPMTLNSEPICECFGFGLVRASDEVKRVFYIVTPLELDDLKKVNALVKGDVMIPDEFFLKQTILNVPLPFTNQSQVAKTTGMQPIPKRAFHNASTPKRNR